MSKPEDIARLKREAKEIRVAAIAIILGMADAIAPTPQGKRELAEGFQAAADMSDDAVAKLSRLVAAALRKAGADA